MDRAEVIVKLNELLAADRAGVEAVALMSQGLPRGFARNELEKMGRDESWSCAGLREAIVRLGGEPTQDKGDFAAKIAALSSFRERLQLMSRGQAWVVKRIDALLAGPLDEETRLFLREMRDAHQHNIDWCDQLAEALSPHDA